MFFSLGKTVGFKGAGDPTWDPKTTITNLRARSRLSAVLPAHLQPHFVAVRPMGTRCAPRRLLPALAGSPLQARPRSAASQSRRLHFQHRLLFLELFIAIMLLIHRSIAAVHHIQMSANALPGPDPNFSCLCKIFSSGLRAYFCSC